MKFSLRLLYLYLFSFIGLLIVVFGMISLVTLGLKTYIFTDVDRYEIYTEAIVTPVVGEPAKMSADEMTERQDREVARQRQRDLMDSIAMLSVGVPLYLYHWSLIKKENKKS